VLMLGLRHWQAGADGRETPSLDGIPYGPGLVLAALVLFENSPWFAAL